MSSLLTWPAFMLLFFINQNNSAMSNIAQTQSIQSNKAVVRSFFEQVLNHKDTSILPSIVSADYKGPEGETGYSGFMESLAPLLTAFPNIHYDIKSLIAEGNNVFVQWTWTGTQATSYRGISAIGKTISNDGMGLFHLTNGKIDQAQVQTDRLAFLQSLGIVSTQIGGGQNAITLIDKFHVPAASIQEFEERVRHNRAILRNLTGFIRDEAYSHTDDQGNMTCITVAIWKDQASIDQAKKAVQEAYQNEGFNMPAMLTRLGITMERGIYKASGDL
jgi:steroid delta-isomerase-like uncharacterized protein